MKKFLSTIILFFACSFIFAQVKLQSLLTENLTDPIGMDIKEPHFSWQLVSAKRNTSQSAYEIKVVSGKSSVWSSGKISSDQSVHVKYAGAALQSGRKYNWKVRVWDNSGKASAWSEVASFQTAFFNASDWKAKWIEAGFVEEASRPSPYFRKTFKTDKKIVSATAYITSHGMY
ncbi:MAG: alpha-L-rhamnosidase, partial [Bacteroidota bacterium]